MAYPTSGKKMLNICILDILKKYTDCDHTMDQKDIIAKLKEDYDITCLLYTSPSPRDTR